MLPFKWPTEIIFVDDDENILELMKSITNIGCSDFKFFNNPITALEYIKSADRFDLSKVITELNEMNFSSREIKVDLKKCFDIANDTSKYNAVSIIISDYEMPYMSGIELFKNVPNSIKAKKILLTGRLSPKEAIDLKGPIIDDYIEKQSFEKFATKLNAKIQNQISLFFQDIASPFKNTLSIRDNNNFVENSTVQDCFNKLCYEKGIYEYYLIDYSGVYYAISKAGKEYIISIQSKEQIDAAIDEYREEKCDYEISEKLNSRLFQVIKLDKRSVVFPYPEEIKNYLFPINEVIDNNFYVSVIDFRAVL